MLKIRLTTVIFLLGIVFCMGLSQTAESEETKADERIPVPRGGFTIVLRAPTSEDPYIVKISKDCKGKNKSKIIEGFSVYLPEKTPIFFRVDEVNTVLYNVHINVDEKELEVETGSLLTVKLTNILEFINLIYKIISVGGQRNMVSDTDQTLKTLQGELKTLQQKLQTPHPELKTLQGELKILEKDLQTLRPELQTLKDNMKGVKNLNDKLDALLYKSDFANIKKDAAKAAEDVKFELTDSAFREFGVKAGKTVEAIHKVDNTVKAIIKKVQNCEYDNLKKNEFVRLLNKVSGVLKHLSLLKDLGDPSCEKVKQVIYFSDQTKKKLRMIEAAKWHKDDAQVRVLPEKITYTCVICPAMELPAEKYSKLDPIEFVVTVNGVPKLSGSQVTFGSFMTDLHDDIYVNIDSKISKGVQDRITENFGILTHIPLCSYNVPLLKFRAAAAISGGIGLNRFSDNDGKFSLVELPTVLGVSLLFAPQKSDDLLALTAGGMMKPVQRLNGYSLGNKFPENDKTVTRPVRTFGWFLAITISYDIRKILKKTNN